jgi:hypothetical protein
MINVPQENWLTYLFKTHSPVIRDIGDQRDPYHVIICACVVHDYPLPKYWREEEYAYQKHFLEVLQEEYFSRLPPSTVAYDGR